MVDSRRMDFDNRTSDVDVSQLCRLCAVQDEHLVPIFEGDGLDLEFEIKLQEYLSLKVCKNDILPHGICLKCSNTLMAWHELYVGCRKAEEKLLAIISRNKDKTNINDVIHLDEDSQDSVTIIDPTTEKNDTTAQKSDLLPNTSITKEGILLFSSKLAALMAKNAESTEKNAKASVEQSRSTKTQGSGNTKFPGLLRKNRPKILSKSVPSATGSNVLSSQGSTINQPTQTTPVGTAQLSKEPENNSTIVIQSTCSLAGTLNIGQSTPLTNDTAQPSKRPDIGNATPVQPSSSQSPNVQCSPVPTPKKVQDQSVMVAGKKFKTIVKPFILSRPENPAPAKPVPSSSQPSMLTPPKTQINPNTGTITLLIPGLVNGAPVFSNSANSKNPVITLPVILPTQTTNPPGPNISQNTVLLVQNPNSEGPPKIVLSKQNISTVDNSEAMNVDDDCPGPSPCSSDTLSQHDTEYNTEVISATSVNKIVSKDKEPGTEPVYIHEDHRYSKVDRAFTPRNTVTEDPLTPAATVKRLVNALERISEENGCFVCGKKIFNRTLLFTHERSHFRSLECLSYNCSLCSESFKTFEEMVSHRKHHQKKLARIKKKIPKLRRTAVIKKVNKPKPVQKTENKENSSLDGSDAIPKSLKKGRDEVSPHIKCVICGLCFSNKVQLGDHKLTHTPEEQANPYLCETCGKRFSNNNSYRSHLKIHSDGPGELCSECGKVFKLRSTLVQHIRKRHNAPNPWPTYLCEVCPKKFDSKAKLLTHANCHTGERPFVCPKCGKAFHSPSNLRQHMACHDEARPHMCHVCGKTFKWPKNLKQHSVTHVSKHLRPKASKLEPVTCDLCGKKLNGEASLKTHTYRFHRDVFFKENPDVQRLPCHLCNKVFSSEINLDIHMKRFHADGQQRFVCQICNKHFTTKNGRDDHVRLHTGERPFACDHCDKTFTCLSNLCAHRDSHSERRPHQCQYCDKMFKRKAHLDCHIRSHTGEKPYVCDVCNRGFAQSNDMRKHRSTHFNERPFQCSFCESTFKKKKELLQHLSSHCVSERQEEEEDEEIDYTAILQSDDTIVAYEVC